MTDLLTRTLDPRPARPVAGALATTVAERLAVIVAPSTGRFRPVVELPASRQVEAGALLGHVTGGRGRADEVRCPVDGAVGSLLVHSGQLVSSGQGLVWLMAEDIA